MPVIRKLRYFIYCRKSSEAEDRQVQSIETQIRELGEFAEKNGLEIVDIIYESQSAHTPGRPKFNEMIQRISAGEANGLLVLFPNRLSRNPVDAGMIIYFMDLKKLVEVRTPSKVYYNTATDKAFLALELIFSKKDSDDKSEHVKTGLRTRYLKGLPNGLAHIGYFNDMTREKGNRDWYEDPVRWPLVKMIFEKFLEGTYSVRKLYFIARDELKLTTPPRKREGGKLISLSYLYFLLRNPVYAGFFYYAKEDGEVVRQDLDKKLKRMITEDQYWQIQDMLGKKGRPRSQKRNLLYGGLIWDEVNNCAVVGDPKFQIRCTACKHKFSYINQDQCPKCGIKIQNMNRPKFKNYVFYASVKERKSPGIKAVSIEEKKLNGEVIDYLVQNFQISKGLADWALRHIDEIKDKELQENKAVTRSNEQSSENGQKKLLRLLDMHDRGLINDEEFSLAKRQISPIQGNKKLAEIENIDWVSEAKKIVNLSIEMSELLENGPFEKKRDALVKFGSNLLFNRGKVRINNTKSISAYINGLQVARSEIVGFEPREYVVNKGESGEFEGKFPALIALADDFRTIDWVNEYPFPSIALAELKELLADPTLKN